MSLMYAHRRFNQTKDYGDLLFYAPLKYPMSTTPTFAKDGNYNILDSTIFATIIGQQFLYFGNNSYCIWDTSIPTDLPSYTLNCWIDSTISRFGYTFGLYNENKNVRPPILSSLQNFIDYLTAPNYRKMILKHSVTDPYTNSNLQTSDSFYNTTLSNCLVSIVLHNPQIGDATSFYINGAYYENVKISLIPISIYPHPCIGDVVFQQNQTLEGNYSHFSIYGKAMTQQEILELYYRGGVPPEI